MYSSLPRKEEDAEKFFTHLETRYSKLETQASKLDSRFSKALSIEVQFSAHRIGLECQHGFHFIVLGHQMNVNGYCEDM